MTNADLTTYDVLLLSTSGGKDSQAMLVEVVRQARELGVFDRCVAIHADLGDVEWAGTKELAQKQAEMLGLPFVVVRNERETMLERVGRPQVKDPSKLWKWADNQNRWCTSDFKRAPIQKWITAAHREHTAKTGRKDFRVLNIMGLRAQESPARAKKAAFQPNDRGTTKSRTVDTWLPIHEWTEDHVWAMIRESGLPHHNAYDLGMPRLSCVFCIFAPKSALVLAGHHNRELLDRYVAKEDEIGFTFRKELSLRQVREAVIRGDALKVKGSELSGGCWNM